MYGIVVYFEKSASVINLFYKENDMESALNDQTSINIAMQDNKIILISDGYGHRALINGARVSACNFIMFDTETILQSDLKDMQERKAAHKAASILNTPLGNVKLIHTSDVDLNDEQLDKILKSNN